MTNMQWAVPRGAVSSGRHGAFVLGQAPHASG